MAIFIAVLQQLAKKYRYNNTVRYINCNIIIQLKRTSYSISNIKVVQIRDIDNIRKYNKERFVLASNIIILDMYIRRYSIIKKDNKTILALEAEEKVSKENRIQLLETLVVVSNKDLACLAKEIVIV